MARLTGDDPAPGIGNVIARLTGANGDWTAREMGSKGRGIAREAGERPRECAAWKDNDFCTVVVAGAHLECFHRGKLNEFLTYTSDNVVKQYTIQMLGVNWKNDRYGYIYE